MVWVTTDGNMETVNRLMTDILVTMNTSADHENLFKIIKLLYGLMGLLFSGEAEPMDAGPAVLECFIFPLRQTVAKLCRILLHTKKNNDSHRQRFSLPA